MMLPVALFGSERRSDKKVLKDFNKISPCELCVNLCVLCGKKNRIVNHKGHKGKPQGSLSYVYKKYSLYFDAACSPSRV